MSLERKVFVYQVVRRRPDGSERVVSEYLTPESAVLNMRFLQKERKLARNEYSVREVEADSRTMRSKQTYLDWPTTPSTDGGIDK